ncbi:hypothetical protein CLV98_1373 [Dyadobacter jejuensis]|uniref:Restriction endonuclease n=1 Tax=Dyadobacter jejuensis TaxID=1082580 RepID=A0A316A2N4_9BACT|nr:hypothetical protein CLV98_1373 [Dyadobacter jejuensis]
MISAGSAFERKPSLYKNKDEEDLRDMFLLFLETRYENTSGHGEAFNRKGKTDILLKYAPDGSNIFVAECKVWTGEIGLGAAIDQLLSYLTHRDSKTALMMFVRNKNFNPVLITAETAIKNHPNFLSFTPKTSTSSYGCMFSLPGNEMSKIQLEVMLFHFLD